jgi:excinuclease ABC subunit C
VLKESGADEIPVISIAKDKSEWAESKKEAEKIYAANTKDPVRFHHNSSALFLIQHIRDEAHRFAITYHKKLRKKTGLKSVLDNIPGIGEKRRKALLKTFGSIKKIKEAPLDELSGVKGMTRKAAEQLLKNLTEMRGDEKNETL